MSVQRDGRETEIYERVMYAGPEPRVPVNKLGLRDWLTLEIAEIEIVARRSKQGLPRQAQEISYSGFKAIHRHLFQDIYDWAGEERTYTTSRNPGVPFARPEHIVSWMEKQFLSLHAANCLNGLAKPDFSRKAAFFVNEINAAHPFIEGNGRVMRLWLQIVADGAGYGLMLDRADKLAWNDAARLGFFGSNEPMAALIASRLHAL